MVTFFFFVAFFCFASTLFVIMESARFIWIKPERKECDISPFPSRWWNSNSRAEWGSLDEGHLRLGMGGREGVLRYSYSFNFSFSSSSTGLRFWGWGSLRRMENGEWRRARMTMTMTTTAKATAKAKAKATAKAKHFIKNFQAIKQNFVQHLPNCVISIWTKCKAAKGPRPGPRPRPRPARWRLQQQDQDVDSWWESRTRTRTRTRSTTNHNFRRKLLSGKKEVQTFCLKDAETEMGPTKGPPLSSRWKGRCLKETTIELQLLSCRAWRDKSPRSGSLVAISRRTSRICKAI